MPLPQRRRQRVDGFAEKIEELVERLRGKIRADRAHERLVARSLRRSGAGRQQHGGRQARYVKPRGEPSSAVGFTICGGQIVEIDILADPARVARLDPAVLDA